jgi:AcrR family transcriptional regulator
MTSLKIHSTIKKPELVEKRQKQICEAAEKLFVKKGFHGTTIRDIARESGLGLGPIYDYVKNKEEILFMVHKRILDINYIELKKSVSELKEPKERMARAIETLLDLANKYQDLYLFIYQEAHVLDKAMQKEIIRAERKTISIFEDIIKQGKKKKIFRDINSRIAANMIVLINHGWVLKRWDLKKAGGSKLDFTINFILKGISL